MRLSYLTTLAEDAEGFGATLEANAKAVAAAPETEWVIFNHARGEASHERALKALAGLPPSVAYARAEAPSRWSVTSAKNLACRLATGDTFAFLEPGRRLGENGPPRVIS